MRSFADRPAERGHQRENAGAWGSRPYYLKLFIDRMAGRIRKPAAKTPKAASREVVGDLDIEPATRSVPSLPGNVCSTRSDGLLIGYKVARQFESHPLRQRVPGLSQQFSPPETVVLSAIFLRSLYKLIRGLP